MASTSQSHLSPPLTPRRLPKLSYRNKSSDSESITTISTDVSRVATSDNSTSPMQSTFCPASKEPVADRRGPTMRSSIVSSPSKTPNHLPRKKAGFLTGLFAKEPSAQALADYEKRLLKQGQKRTGPVGIAGVSSSRLPPTVPKVNSKWDGVPRTVKDKERQRQDHKKHMSGHSRNTSTIKPTGPETRSSTTSTSQRRLSRGTLGGQSTRSNASSNKLADLYGWECNTISSSSSAVVDFAAAHRPATARLQTSHSAPPASEKPPPLERMSSFPPRSTLQILTSLQPNSPSSPLDPTYPPSHSHSPALTPFESLPATPEGPPPLDIPPFHLSEAGSHDDIRTTMVEAPASVNEVIIKSAGLNILGPPATAKRRPKATPHQSPSVPPKTSSLDAPLNSILKKNIPIETAPCSAGSSYFPSPDSASSMVHKRHNSARDRLGLGMSVKSQAVAPWSSPDRSGDAVDSEMITTPTPENGRCLGKKGRISFFRM